MGGFILNVGKFFMAQKNYEQAIREAIAARQETVTLKNQSELIITKASDAFTKQLRSENPPTIYLTTTWGVKSRQDISGVKRSQSDVRMAYAAKSRSCRRTISRS